MKPAEPTWEGMKPERTQFDISLLDGWTPINGSRAKAISEQKLEGLWTAFEMTDHLKACQLVAELGGIAAEYGITPDLDVRGTIVYLTVGTDKREVIAAEFEFALEVDRRIGDGHKCRALTDH